MIVGLHDPFKVVVEVAKDVMREVQVKVGGYSDNRYVEICCGNVHLHPCTLTVTTRRVSVTELLLNTEICKFVMDSNPELKDIKFR